MGGPRARRRRGGGARGRSRRGGGRRWGCRCARTLEEQRLTDRAPALEPDRGARLELVVADESDLLARDVVTHAPHARVRVARPPSAATDHSGSVDSVMMNACTPSHAGALNGSTTTGSVGCGSHDLDRLRVERSGDGVERVALDDGLRGLAPSAGGLERRQRFRCRHRSPKARRTPRRPAESHPPPESRQRARRGSAPRPGSTS